jgi:hypothetical protein
LFTKGSHPSAPSASLEKWIPVLIGSKAGPPYRSPISTPYGSRRAALDSVGAASLLVPGILTNTGRTGGRVEVVYASHALAAFDDDTIGCDVFIRGQDTVASMDYTGTKTNDASGAKIAFDLATLFARIGVIPIGNDRGSSGRYSKFSARKKSMRVCGRLRNTEARWSQCCGSF